jgi:enterochelin esterase family protein
MVTFRVMHPKAQSVVLQRENGPRAPMSKDDRGLWSVTIGPLKPGIYTYTFSIDGVSTPDLSNPGRKLSVSGGHESLLTVPGKDELWQTLDVPHGTLHLHTYLSKVAGDTRSFYVYTPPGYEKSRERYPVLALLHGATDDESAWISAGRLPQTLDNLIARRRAVPMIVVMPHGYGFPNAAQRIGELFGPTTDMRRVLGDFSRTLMDEVLPAVDSTYRTQTRRESRAVAGLSMGGAQAFHIGVNHRDRFAWVGAFSSAFVMYRPDPDNWFPTLKAGASPAHRLLWIACGRDDFLINNNRSFTASLRTKGVPFQYNETDGAHTWTVWRNYIAEFLPLLFR